jgi:hypothetical protein
VIGADISSFPHAFSLLYHCSAIFPCKHLVDEFIGGDRALVIINQHWKHVGKDFFGIKPTGESGTSVEVFILWLRDGKVAQMNVADNTPDLTRYILAKGFEALSGAHFNRFLITSRVAGYEQLAFPDYPH